MVLKSIIISLIVTKTSIIMSMISTILSRVGIIIKIISALSCYSYMVQHP